MSSATREIEGQSDASRMRMIVQKLAREVIPDTHQIVRSAVDEQGIAVVERFNTMFTELHSSVRRLVAELDVSEEKETSARGRLVGSARAAHRRPRLRVSFSPLIPLVWIVVVWLLVCGKP